MSMHREAAAPAPRLVGPAVRTLLWFGGVILPLLALAGAIVIGLCWMPGLFSATMCAHALLIVSVPLANAQLLRALHGESPLPSRRMALLHSFATGVSAVFAVLFLPLTALGVIAIVYFGAGLLLLAPLLSLCAALAARRLLRRTRPQGGAALGPLWPGMLLALAIVAALELPTAVTRIGMSMANGANPATRDRGVLLLRHLGNETMMRGLCYQIPSPGTDLVGVLQPFSFPIGAEQARAIYYRVNGIAFNALPVPSALDPGRLGLNRDAGASIVGGRAAGLRLAGSRIEGTLDARAALASLDWTITFRNDALNQQEARAQANLPAGAVVTGVAVLDGASVREGLVGGAALRARQQAAQASGRAPALVTTAGKDRIMLHLRDIPGQGELTVRIALVAPLVLNELRLGFVQLPSFSERNVDIGDGMRHAVSLESASALRGAPGMREEPGATLPFALRGELAEPLPGMGAAIVGALRAPSDTHAWSPDPSTPGGAIVQTIVQRAARIPRRVALVVDGSVALAAQREQLARAATSFPGNVELGVIVAGSQAPQVFLHDPSDSLASVRYLQDIAFEGGNDNSAALLAAWEWAAASSDGAVVWIHGPQPLMPGSGDALLQHYRQRPGQVRLFDLEAASGRNVLWERMDGIAALARVPRIGSLHDDLVRLLSGWKPAAQQVVVERSRAGASQPAAQQASPQLARLWAGERAMVLRAKDALATPGEAGELARLERLLAATAQAPGAPALAVPEAAPSGAAAALAQPGWELCLLIALALVAAGWRVHFHLRTPYPSSPHEARAQ
ncbi:hypothetical protein HF313_01390 [Massilia atriviolacea]|nr:hypothetical protein [Massilia atriviolacea]